MKYLSAIKFSITMILFIALSAELQCQWVTNHDAIYQGNLTKPSYLQKVKDPNFGTDIIRISDCVTNNKPGIVPQYSKRNAWNCCETYLMLQSCSGEVLIYDGMTYEFIKTIDNVYGDDIFWHASNPDVLYCAIDSIFYSYNIKTDERTPIRVFEDYTWINTRGEGNMSINSQYYAFVGQTYTNEEGTKFEDLILFDVSENRIISKMELPNHLEDFDWVSVSPNGKYIVVDYATANTGRYEGVEVYDSNFNFIWQKPLGAGHSDLGVDGNGDEVLVMTYYNDETNEMEINKYRLSDGKETKLLTHNWAVYNHISCRNLIRYEWCFVSTYDGEGRLTDSQQDWLPFEDEIFALKLDGSGEVQRLAHHRSKRFSPQTPDSDNSVYFAEPHACVSPTGSRVVFGSNWRQNINQENALDAYVVDFREWLDVPENTVVNKSNISITPNPATEYISITFEQESFAETNISIYTSLGEIIQSINKVNSPGKIIEYLDISTFPSGSYTVVISYNTTKHIQKLNIIK